MLTPLDVCAGFFISHTERGWGGVEIGEGGGLSREYFISFLFWGGGDGIFIRSSILRGP